MMVITIIITGTPSLPPSAQRSIQALFLLLPLSTVYYMKRQAERNQLALLFSEFHGSVATHNWISLVPMLWLVQNPVLAYIN